MALVIAAIRSGTDPVAPLPPASFHRTLEEPIYCPKCEVCYNLVVDYDVAVNKFFAEESRRHVSLLKKAVMLGHGAGHRVSHFETNGVMVVTHVVPARKPTLADFEMDETRRVN